MIFRQVRHFKLPTHGQIYRQKNLHIPTKFTVARNATTNKSLDFDFEKQFDLILNV